MTINYNLTGEERKKLVKAISIITGMESSYLGAPTFAYLVGDYHIDRNGSVSANISLEGLAEQLKGQGFEGTPDGGTNAAETPQQTITKERLAVAEGIATEARKTRPVGPLGVPQQVDGMEIKVPRVGFTANALTNLHKLVESKQVLLKKALGVDELPIVEGDDWVTFPWMVNPIKAEEAHAFTSLICGLCQMAKTQKRITAKEKTTDNEKYAFRCFLMRLGFIGDEYKEDRKILLRNLSGNGAFKAGAKKEDGSAADGSAEVCQR